MTYFTLFSETCFMSDNSDQKSNPEADAVENVTPIKSDIESAQDEAAKWKNEYLYLRAEFENYKKNSLKERSDLLKFGAERVLRDLLEVVDNFDRALAQQVTAENLGQFKTGIELTAKEFKDALTKNGVQEVSSLGQPFNPLVHEAISSEPTNAVTEGHVTQVFKKPYKLHDKIIRLGQVVVATAMKTNNQDNK